MTYANIRNVIWTGLGTTSSEATDLVPDSDTIDRWIELAESDIISRILALPRERWQTYLYNYSDFAYASGDGSATTFSLPSDYMIDWGVKVGSVTCVRVDEDYERLSDANTFYTPNNTYDPKYYVGAGYLIFLVAPATGTNNIKAGYYKTPAAITAGGTSSLPDRLHELIPWYCLSKAFAIDGDDEQSAVLMAKYVEAAKQLII